MWALCLTSFTEHPCCSIYHTSFMFKAEKTFHCMNILYFVYASVGKRWVVSTFQLLWMLLLWTFIYRFSWGQVIISLEYIPRSEIAHHMVSLCLTLCETAELFSTVAVPFSIPTSGVWGFLFFPILVTLVTVHIFITAASQSVWGWLFLWFHFASPWWLMVSSIFSWTYCLFVGL